jgi:hypothetical protein
VTTTETATETTLTKFAGWYRNYSTRPSIDVEVLPDENHCAECGEKVVYIASQWGTSNGHNAESAQWMFLDFWMHADGSVSHDPRPRPRCFFCHGDEAGTVEHLQLNWSDETYCSRCGGRNGFGIGD